MQNHCLLDDMTDWAYRGLEDHLRAHRRSSERDLPPCLTTAAAGLRAIMTYHLLTTRVERLLGSGCLIPVRRGGTNIGYVRRWWPALQRDASRMDWTMAIGEHCGFFPTHQLNLTSDWRIALWFATHAFDSGQLRIGQSCGLIYRIRCSTLRRVISEVNTNRGWSAPDHARLLNLRGIPQEVALRPHSQRGWTLLYSQPPWIVARLIELGGLEAFRFRVATDYPYLEASAVRPEDCIIRAFRRTIRRGWRSISRARFERYKRELGATSALPCGDLELWKAAFEDFRTT